MKRTTWQGDIVFSHSMAIFRGQVGDNRLHSHWASQLTISLDSELVFETDSVAQSAKAVYFPSNTAHRLEPGFVCSIYFDPLAESIPTTLRRGAAEGWAPLSLEDLPRELASIDASTDLRALLNSELLSPPDMACPEPRFEKVIQEIRTRLAEGKDIDRDALAEIAHLSPTRFSHWFVERTGVPLRSYKKWLKLRVAVDAVLEGRNPMEAAVMAGFSDLAHMSRAFSESFGFTYTDALRAWEQTNQL
ncbi:MAG: AraC family transcriptional regulator [Marinobacter sp.]